MSDYPITDHNGHKYHNEHEVRAAIHCLDADAKYLRGAVEHYRDPAVKQRVSENAAKSAAYAQELRDMCLIKTGQLYSPKTKLEGL